MMGDLTMTGLAGWTKVGPAGATGSGRRGATLTGAAGKIGTTRAAGTGEWAGGGGAARKSPVWSLFLNVWKKILEKNSLHPTSSLIIDIRTQLRWQALSKYTCAFHRFL